MFEGFDQHVVSFFGRFAGRHELFDRLAVKTADLYSIKLLPLVAVVFFLWFRKDDTRRSHGAVTEAVIGMVLAVLISRLVQDFMPLQLRPMHSGNPAFVAPIGANTTGLEHWSSFPSDHAAVAFALATAVFGVSGPLGTACYLWAAMVDCLPRVYVGYHYATDVIGGAAIGVAAVLCFRVLLPRTALVSFADRLNARYPGAFTAGLFVLMFQFATMFDDVRTAFRGLYTVLF